MFSIRVSTVALLRQDDGGTGEPVVINVVVGTTASPRRVAHTRQATPQVSSRVVVYLMRNGEVAFPRPAPLPIHDDTAFHDTWLQLKYLLTPGKSHVCGTLEVYNSSFIIGIIYISRSTRTIKIVFTSVASLISCFLSTFLSVKNRETTL